MAVLHQFLQRCHAAVHKIDRIVIGNAALDMDTAATTISYAYYLTATTNDLHFPVFNIERKDFRLKTEVKYVYTDLQIATDQLIFLDDLPDKNKRFETTLVDCNIYKGPLSNLDVVRIQDHHKPETDIQSLKYASESQIILGLGSASTLILELFKNSEEPTPAECIKMLHASVVVDTTNFNPHVGYLGPRDIKMHEYVKSLESIKPYSFEELHAAKCSLEGFSRGDVLNKDAKYIENGSVIIAVLPCDMSGFKALEAESIRESMDKFLTENGLKQIFAVTVPCKDDCQRLYRDCLIYPKISKEFNDFMTSDEQLAPIELQEENADMTVLRWFNMKPTRKYILPKLVEFYSK